jgi:hypothetical protein
MLSKKNLKDKIIQIEIDIGLLKNKMIQAYKNNDYFDGNFYYKLLVEREKILSKLQYR